MAKKVGALGGMKTTLLSLCVEHVGGSVCARVLS